MFYDDSYQEKLEKELYKLYRNYPDINIIKNDIAVIEEICEFLVTKGFENSLIFLKSHQPVLKL